MAMGNTPTFKLFQHTAARRRLVIRAPKCLLIWSFQHTAARRRLAASFGDIVSSCGVSTHSRPKAAGCFVQHLGVAFGSFNTQPPEGGWLRASYDLRAVCGFQHTAARRRLESAPTRRRSRVCFNTQPPEGGWISTVIDCAHSALFQHTAARRRLVRVDLANDKTACFNTQPPEGGWYLNINPFLYNSRFNTQPPEGGWFIFFGAWS